MYITFPHLYTKYNVIYIILLRITHLLYIVFSSPIQNQFSLLDIVVNPFQISLLMTDSSHNGMMGNIVYNLQSISKYRLKRRRMFCSKKHLLESYTYDNNK